MSPSCTSFRLIESPACAGLGFTFGSQALRSVSAVSSSYSYGWIVHFRLLFTSLHSDAISFSFSLQVFLEWTFTSLTIDALRRTAPAYAGETVLI